MKNIFLLSLIISIISFSCNNNEIKIFLSNPETFDLTDIPSASGIEFYNDKFYLVGDDIPWLFILNQELKIIDKTKISGIDSLIAGRTPKDVKADFESIGINHQIGNNQLVIVSSGSMVDSRDTAYIVALDNFEIIASKNIRSLFEKIKLDAKLAKDNEINIEGLVFTENHGFLFHRGNVSENFIARINKSELLYYLEGSSTLPGFEIFWFNLPVYRNVVSGFSGACLHPEGTGIIFTASMEATVNEIDDGSILGSYLGYIPFETLSEGKYSAALFEYDGNILEKKIESICVVDNENTKNNTRKLNLIAITDNDDGTSDFIKINMEIK